MSRLTTMSPDAIKAVFSADSDSDLITLLTFYDPTSFLVQSYSISSNIVTLNLTEQHSFTVGQEIEVDTSINAINTTNTVITEVGTSFVKYFKSGTTNTSLTVISGSITSNNPSVRLCDNYLTRISETADDVTYGVTSRTNNFIFLPLQITLPQEDEAQAPRVTIVINDVTRYITPIIRSLSKPPKVLIELVLSKSPDTVEVSFSGFYVSSFTYNADQVSAELSMVDYEREPFPMHTFSPKYFPGLF